MKAKASKLSLRSNKSTGQVLKIVAAIQSKNAVTNEEALELARRAVLKFGHN